MVGADAVKAVTNVRSAQEDGGLGGRAYALHERQ